MEKGPLPMTIQSYSVSGMSCDHCKVAVTEEVAKVAGVSGVDVEIGFVRVRGTGVEHAAIVAAIDEAGYDAVPA
jgi:copper chaperone